MSKMIVVFLDVPEDVDVPTTPAELYDLAYGLSDGQIEGSMKAMLHLARDPNRKIPFPEYAASRIVALAQNKPDLVARFLGEHDVNDDQEVTSS